MKAAIIDEAGRSPRYGDFMLPADVDGHWLIKVLATSISQITRHRASGSHYSAAGAYPIIPGVDGIGVAPTGERVHFLFPRHPFGAMAEYCLVDPGHCCVLPDGLSDEAAAAMAIPGMSSWAALVERARMQVGETVLINGAAGISGRLAIQVARHLGAARIIVTARRESACDELRRLGADAAIPLEQSPDELQHALEHVFGQGVDVVLDYLWGPSSQASIIAAAKASPDGKAVRWVQIGSIGGASVELPGAALRSSALTLMGSGIGSVPFARLTQAIRSLLGVAPSAGFRVAVDARPLSQVETAWSAVGSARIVMCP